MLTVAAQSSMTNSARPVSPQNVFRHPVNRFFIGQQDTLDKICTALCSDISQSMDTSPPTFTIWGLPEQGKTQTALHFARQQTSKFQSIHFVFAETEHKLLEYFSEYAQIIGLVPEGSGNLIQDARELIRWYETTGV